MSQTKAQLVSGLSINASAPATAFNIDASGRVGIGTTSPAAPLDLAGDFIGRATTIRIKDSGNTTQYFALYGDSTSAHLNSGVNNLVLYSAGTERARIDSSGRLLVGTSTAVSAGSIGIQIKSTSASASNIESWNEAASGTIFHAVFRDGASATSRGSITTNGSATAFNTSSDYRLKENLVPLTGAVDRLQQIPVHRFNFIADPNKTVDGFIAHEAQEVVPECVTGEKDAVDDEGNPVYQGIDQSKLVPLLTAALQEAIAEIGSLKDRVAALEAS